MEHCIRISLLMEHCIRICLMMKHCVRSSQIRSFLIKRSLIMGHCIRSSQIRSSQIRSSQIRSSIIIEHCIRDKKWILGIKSQSYGPGLKLNAMESLLKMGRFLYFTRKLFVVLWKDDFFQVVDVHIRKPVVNIIKLFYVCTLWRFVISQNICPKLAFLLFGSQVRSLPSCGAP